MEKTHRLSTARSRLLFPLAIACSALAANGNLSAQQGYLVLLPIDNGPVSVFVDGSRAATLGNQEVTLELMPGSHQIEARKDGVVAFTRTVTVPRGDVIQLQVTLAEQVRIREDQTEGGAVVTGALRVIHLDPVEVPIRVGERLVGNTPATLEVPVGNVELRIGRANVCLRVTAGSTARIRLRAGRVEQVTGAETCADYRPAVVLNGLPAGARVFVDGDQQRTTARPEVPFRIQLPDAGTYNIAIEHGAHLPLEFDVRAVERHDILVTLALGPQRPALSSDTVALALPSRPVRPTQPARPQAPIDLSPTIEALHSDLGRMRTETAFDWIGAIVALGGITAGSLMYDSSKKGSGEVQWQPYAVGAGGITMGLLLGKAANPDDRIKDECSRRGRYVGDSDCRTHLQATIDDREETWRRDQASYSRKLTAFLADSAAYAAEAAAGFPDYTRQVTAWEEETERLKAANAMAARLAEQNRERLESWVIRARQEQSVSRITRERVSP